MRPFAYISFITVILLSALAPASSMAQQNPVISGITLNPNPPFDGEDVLVTANVTADSAIASVVIFDLNVGNNIPMESAGASAYRATIPAQPAATTVTFKIRATDVAGRATASPQQSYFVGLEKPGNLQATFDDASGNVTLTWNGVPGASSYTVLRSLVSPADLELKSGITTTTFIDDRVGSARELYYAVFAVKGGVKSDTSNEASIQRFNSSPLAIGGSRFDTLLVAPSSTALDFPELRINLDNLFRDENGDDLTYAVQTPTLMARIEDDSVLVATFPPQLTVVSFTVSADDGNFGIAFITFFVTLDAPPSFVIDGDEPALGEEPVKDKPVRIRVTVEDNNLEQVQMNFRRGGDASFFSDSMTAISANQYEYSIPAFAVGERGLEYWMVARDAQGLSKVAPNLKDDNKFTYSIEVSIPEEGVRKERAQPSIADNTNAYRLFSLPIIAANPSPAAVFEDDLGSYKKSKWRFFEPAQQIIPQALLEFPNTKPLTPGAAFWLVVRGENLVIDSGPGKSVTTDEPFRIDLEPGWNYIGNPFSFDVPVRRLIASTGAPIDIRFFDGNGWSRLDASASILPFEGYAISNNSNVVSTLSIYPSDDLLPAPNPAARADKTEPGDEGEVLINIIAEAGTFKDSNQIILQKNSAAGWDVRDQPEPPFIGDYVSLYFPHDDWDRPLKMYSTDARPLPTDGDTWAFNVASTLDKAVNLTFEGVDDLPEGLEALLIDEQLQVTQRLGEHNAYQVTSSSQHPQKLKLVIGSASFTADQKHIAELATTDFQLSPNFPNPFNQTTTIPFTLPETSSVTMQVFNLLGERVVTLIESSSMPAGRQSVVWDGSNEAGQSVANGLYLVRFTAGTFVASRKVLVLR